MIFLCIIYQLEIQENPENKPRGLCLLKALFEELIFKGGLYSEGLI